MERIEVSKKEEALALIQILANNGYRTQIIKEKKPNSSAYTIYVEYSK